MPPKGEIFGCIPQVPVNPEFIDKVCRSMYLKWDVWTTYQKNKAIREVSYWIEIINKNL